MTRTQVLLMVAALPLSAQARRQPDAAAAMHLIDQLTASAQAAEARKDYAGAEQDYGRVLKIMEGRADLPPGLAAVALHGLAAIEDRRQHFTAAAELGERRLRILEKLPGPVNLDVGDGLMEIGSYYLKAGDGEKGKAFMQKSIDFFDKCSGATGNVPVIRRACGLKLWDTMAVWAGLLYLSHRDEEAEPIARKIIDAPSGRVRPSVLALALRLEANLLARSGKGREAVQVLQRSEDYAREHPADAARFAAGPPSELEQKARLKFQQLGKSMMAGDLQEREDFSAYGAYASALSLTHDAYWREQELIKQTRTQFAELALEKVLTPELAVDPQAVAAARGKVQAGLIIL